MPIVADHRPPLQFTSGVDWRGELTAASLIFGATVTTAGRLRSSLHAQKKICRIRNPTLPSEFNCRVCQRSANIRCGLEQREVSDGDRVKIKVFMPKRIITVFGGLTLIGSFLVSCDTPTGTGAAAGAGAGAIIGNIAGHGGAQSTLIGAAAGAAAGALIGHAIQEDHARQYGPEPEGGYPVAEWSGQPGLVVSPYPPHRLVDVRGIPRGALVRDPASNGIFRKP